MKLILSTAFKKDYKKLSNNQKVISEIDNVILLLSKGQQLSSKYREHILQGNWKGYHECHIFPDLLIIYKHDTSEDAIKLARLGNHSQLFG
jgi:mRNA interferase YafQ